MEVEMGKGDVMVGGVTRREDKCYGLLFRKVDQQHEIGEKDSDWKEGDQYEIKECDVVVWIPSLASARVVLERISIINLELNGFKVGDV